jgi:hypothetical protein
MDINELLSKFDSGQLIGLVLGGIALTGGLVCGVVGIIAGVFHGRHNAHRAEVEAALKQDMLNRGMSAQEIQAVMEAGTKSQKAC